MRFKPPELSFIQFHPHQLLWVDFAEIVTKKGFKNSQNIVFLVFFGVFFVFFWCFFGVFLVFFWCFFGVFLVFFWCFLMFFGVFLVFFCFFLCFFGVFSNNSRL